MKMKPTNLRHKKEKEKVYNSVTKLYNEQFKVYFNKYYKLLDAKRQCWSEIQAYGLKT